MNINPILPFEMFTNPQQAVREMRIIKRKYGIKRFMLTGPGQAVRISGFPSREVFERIGDALSYCNEQLAPEGVEVGWWCSPSLSSGDGRGFQNIVGINGVACPISSCPLGQQFVNAFTENIKTLVARGKPFMIQFEDDYELSNHPQIGGFGCFCPLHLEKFSQQTGKYYSREELAEIFSSVTAESTSLRQLWSKMGRDTMTGLSQKIRFAVDEVRPETRICLCQPGCCDLDGDMTEHVARAFAGKNTQAAVRLYGSAYSHTDSGYPIPSMLLHAMYSAEHLPKDFELFYETDSFPHTRYFSSAAFLESSLYTAFASGLHDSLLYAAQYLDDPCEEKGYFNMYKENRIRFNAFRNSLKGFNLDGCQIIHRPDACCGAPVDKDNYAGRNDSRAWADILGRNGIPFTTRKRHVKMLNGLTANVMSDLELKDALSGGLFLDGEAAQILYNRGFAEYLGIKIGGMLEPCFSHERLAEIPEFADIKGRFMYNRNLRFKSAGFESGTFIKIETRSAKAMTYLVGAYAEDIQPGITCFENAMGGRVAVLAGYISSNYSSNIFNYRKKEIIRRIITWLNKDTILAATLINSANEHLMFNVNSDRSEAIFTVNNLSSDIIRGSDVLFNPEWNDSTLFELKLNGEWKAIKPLNSGSHDTIRLPGLFKPMKIRIFKLVKNPSSKIHSCFATSGSNV
ncbi:MAG: hypothetical protein A2X49_08415 [Lentisphaerae bacterium GWF2_52_8]|nr:MAG: hypothetical protein A2X49_08415 [Lentisphaerae bacterium GWF2_52_8]